MRCSRTLIALMVALAVSLAAAAEDALASYPLGTNCAAASGVGNKIALDPATSTASSDGVIVKWGYGVAADIWPRRLVVLQRDADPSKWNAVYVSESLFNPPGAAAETAARIPIAKGQVVGIWSTGPYVPTCAAPSSTMLELSIASIPTAGRTFNAAPTSNVTTSLVAQVEPDADKDGFGDETQDRCSQSGKISDSCPTLIFSAAQKNTAKAFRLLLTTNITAPVTATGTARLSKRKRVTFKSIEYVSSPGAITTLKLDYPRSLTNALKKLTKKRTIKTQIAVTAIGVTNNVVTNYTVKLRGTKSKAKKK